MPSFPALGAVLLLAFAPCGAQDPKPSAPAAPASPLTPMPSTPKSKAAPKNVVKLPKGDRADVRPEVAMGSQARAKSLKAQKPRGHAPAGPAVDINHASKAELMALPGVTEAYADKLIAHRPYKTRTHLVTQDVLPYALYTSLKARLAAK